MKLRPSVPLVRLESAAALGLAATIGLAMAVPASAATAATPHAGYTYTIIADSADGFEPSEFGCASLNNAGQVAFRAVDTNDVQGIYRGDADELNIIARDKPDKYDFLGRNPSINDAGQVSFAATLKGPGEAILRGDGTTLDTVALTVGTPFRFFGFDTSINEAGRVAFKAELDNDDQGLFSAVSSDASKNYYLSSDDRFGGDQSGPSIRGNRIAFFDTTGDFTAGVFVTTKNDFDTAVDTLGPYGGFDLPALGRHGTVAVHAFNDDGSADSIIKARNGVVKPVVDSSGKFSAFGFHTPSINASGKVAYAANLGFTTPTGVYTGKNGRPVLEVGDALAGSTVANVVGCTEMLNDGGQIAMTVQLDDGRTVVARADHA